MARIITATDEDYNIVYPKTLTDAVYDNNGTPLKTILSNKVDRRELGVPIYTTPRINSLPNDLIPSEYIDIGNPTLEGEPQDNTITINPQSGDYLQILFSAVRKLQAEVARLKNSFYYGLQSEIEGNTTSSNIIADTEEEEQEPLWAIDPEDLSEIEGQSISIGSNCELRPSNGWTYADNTNYINILSETVVTQSLSGYDIEDEYTAPKVLMYSVVDPTNENWEFNINFNNESSLKIQDIIGKQKFSILFIVSRRMQSDTDTTYNKNFYWISITDETGNPIYQKYLNQDLNPSNSELDFDDISMIRTISMQNLKLYKLNYYTKDVSFTNTSNIESQRPTVDNFIIKPTHITIRSVSNYNNMIVLTERFMENELIWCSDEEHKGLYIKSNFKIIPIGSISSQITTILQFSKTLLEINVGDIIDYMLAFTNSPSPIQYSVDNSTIATINSDGIITGISVGETIVRAHIDASGEYIAKDASYVLKVKSNSTQPPSEEPTTQWKFGDNFPIILSGSTHTSWRFGDSFPIILSGNNSKWVFNNQFPIIFN